MTGHNRPLDRDCWLVLDDYTYNVKFEKDFETPEEFVVGDSRAARLSYWTVFSESS